jgi:hypothetical protein
MINRRMIMKSHLIGIAMLLSATEANAQVPVPTPQGAPSAFGVDPIMRVTSVFRAKIEGVNDLRDVPDIKAQEAVRKSLYDMAANECAILAETLKAECRLSNISIIPPNTIIVGSYGIPPALTATALYELRPRRQ